MKIKLLVAIVLAVLPLSFAGAVGWRNDSGEIKRINRKLAGKVLDYTANHGRDNRIFSRSMWQRRDLYVYLPPHFDGSRRYPIIYFLHGFAFDEQMFLRVIPQVDEAIAKGKFPPVIIAAPDGSVKGEPSMHQPGTFFINSQAGDFEDFLLIDVWDFMTSHFPIRPEREAHVLAGVSMGGGAAFDLAIRNRDCFGVVAGMHPSLNLRWIDCDGNYMGNFDPHRWAWRDQIKRPHEPIAILGAGAIKIRMSHLLLPLFGNTDEAIVEISKHNPIELIDRTRLRNGDLEMFVAYAGQDEFNIDAQVESFLYLAKHRGLGVHVVYDPQGHHDALTSAKLLPHMLDWLAPRLAPYCH
ncbi:MAG: esterase family protein [Gemmataceae bacterium]|nr:esterase family protein [Gemmataceae bacterium]